MSAADLTAASRRAIDHYRSMAETDPEHAEEWTALAAPRRRAGGAAVTPDDLRDLAALIDADEHIGHQASPEEES